MFAEVFEDHFVVEPPNPKMKCTAVSVLSHLMYENADPYCLYEPSGMLDTSESKYEQVNERSVKVSGSKFIPSDRYTIRLEGVQFIGFRRIAIGGIRDPFVLKQLSSFLDEASAVIRKKVKESLGIDSKDYEMLFRLYGLNGVMGRLEPHQGTTGHEVGCLIEVVALNKEMSQSIMSIAWHTLLHHPIKEWSGLVSQLAFPFSPPDVDMGPAFQFALNHVVEVSDPCELFEIQYLQIE